MKKIIGTLLFVLFGIGLVAHLADAQNPSLTSYLVGSTGVPSLGSCGSSPALSPDASDWGGSVTVGTGIFTACTVNWSVTMNKNPICVTELDGIIVAKKTSVTPTGMTVTGLTGLAGATVSWHCALHQPS